MRARTVTLEDLGSHLHHIHENINLTKEEEFFYIVTDKCTECNGFHDEPQCAVVCPVDCCIIDDDNIETKEELLDKKYWLHKD